MPQRLERHVLVRTNFLPEAQGRRRRAIRYMVICAVSMHASGMLDGLDLNRAASLDDEVTMELE